MRIALEVLKVELIREISKQLWIRLKSWALIIERNERDFLELILAGLAVLVFCALVYVFF